MYRRSIDDPEGFWAETAEAELAWSKPWDKVLTWNLPWARWFDGGELNLSANCLDRHLATRGDKVALVWEGEPGDSRKLTYRQLHAEVCKFANVLKGLGVGAGDRVAIYLPMIPEAAIAMLACARIGATAHGRLRRLLGRGAARSDQRLRRQALHHRRRRLAARQGRPAQGQRRRGAGARRRPSKHCVVVAPHRRGGAR